MSARIAPMAVARAAIRGVASALVIACASHQPAAGAPHGAATPPAESRVAVVDLTSKFLVFYDSATARHADPDERWALWKRLYGFAAVPPTTFGQELARRLLDSAWARYPQALPGIRRGIAGLAIVPDSVLGRVAHLLGCGASTPVRLTIFVGGFEDNAFAFTLPDGTPVIAVPVEVGNPELSMTHEFTHAIHHACATFASGYAQSLAQLVISEGLAQRATERLLPGHPAAFYTHAAPGWLEAAGSRRPAILRGIRDHVADADAATMQRFTFGGGTTGTPREAYYAGWEIVGAMLSSGMSFHDIATEPADRLPNLVTRAIDRLLN